APPSVFPPADDSSAAAPGGAATPAAAIDAGTTEASATEAGATEVDRPAVSGPATLRYVMEQLRAGHDILYLVCHGALVRGESWLWLEDEAGVTARVAGADLAARLRDLPQRPRLVVLVSCHSAGGGAGFAKRDEDAGMAVLSALGPRLAEAGVPAVLAMHGAFSLQTAARFMPAFFQELQRDGQIDRAVALARGSVREQPDAWMPVLFMRLRSGRIWYEPGFDAGQKEFEKWPALLRRISDGRCTPILGPGLLESLLGSPREIARRWSDTFDFPMAEYDREDLPQVAQFLAIDQDYDFPRGELAKHLEDELKRRYGADLPAELGAAPLAQLLQAAGAQQRQRDPAEPHQVLAQLPVPIYISTNPDNLMAESLAAAGKQPEVVICPWKDDVDLLPSIYEREPDYLPEPSRPLVYHLFGHLREPDSVVLTEDDYFDYLIGVTSNRNLVPAAVRRALANTSLLFLGFDLTGWDFRVLFRSIVDQEGGRALRKRYAHVAAQIDPQQGRFLEPDRARQYLETYFQGAEISIYWGSAESFVRELQRRWIQDGATPGA
ncbi:MAG: SIR2 family protein, partial [Chloroflexota bacterium]|nr:SIR2 family protein [Chloroflexota bacterium]